MKWPLPYLAGPDLPLQSYPGQLFREAFKNEIVIIDWKLPLSFFLDGRLLGDTMNVMHVIMDRLLIIGSLVTVLVRALCLSDLPMLVDVPLPAVCKMDVKAHYAYLT